MTNPKTDIKNETPEGLLQKSLQNLSESGKYQEILTKEKEEIKKIRKEVSEMKEFPAGYIPSASDIAKLQTWNDEIKQLVSSIKNKCECQLKMARLKCNKSQNYLDLAMTLEQLLLRVGLLTTTIVSQKYLSLSFAIIARSDEISKAFQTLDIDFCLDSHREPTTKNEHVYFLLSKKSKTLKIGYSSHLSNRIKSLQSSSPDSLTLPKAIPGSKQLEAELHKKFAANRLHGEWFSATPEVIEYIRSL